VANCAELCGELPAHRNYVGKPPRAVELCKASDASTRAVELRPFVRASLVPFATAWVAATRIAAVPAFLYAGVIVMVNLSYHGFAYEVVHRSTVDEAHKAIRRLALARSTLTLGLFASAMLVSLRFPVVGFVVVTGVLLTYARPEAAPVTERRRT
jgi:hypothetical protein